MVAWTGSQSFGPVSDKEANARNVALLELLFLPDLLALGSPSPVGPDRGLLGPHRRREGGREGEGGHN